MYFVSFDHVLDIGRHEWSASVACRGAYLRKFLLRSGEQCSSEPNSVGKAEVEVDPQTPMFDAGCSVRVSPEEDAFLTAFLRNVGAQSSSEGNAREAAALLESEEEDDFSDVSSDSDIFRAEVLEDKSR